MLTFSLSGLRRGPHSALLDTGGYGPGSGFACGRLSLGEPLIEQPHLAFLGMWRCSTRPDLAELLPFDADAGSSSNMVSSQPDRTLGLQSLGVRDGESCCARFKVINTRPENEERSASMEMIIISKMK